MSLKAFHLVFIILSILLTLMFGIWGVVNHGSSGKTAELVMGIISLAGTVGLSVYLRYFLKRLKHVSYL
ncbi:hypothetical protein OAK15_00805 [Verrucomicrobia bacterium]|jgi:heme/copper-type cytochrome/quinol oxidase subunit 4|nr:hypothetical protein [Verrucomicrobiota bacterium]